MVSTATNSPQRLSAAKPQPKGKSPCRSCTKHFAEIARSLGTSLRRTLRTATPVNWQLEIVNVEFSIRSIFHPPSSILGYGFAALRP
jgi:hypothetical protein